MNLFARTLAALAALAGLVVGLAGLIRAAALAADEGLVWELPSWWTEFVDGGSPLLVGLAALAAAAASVLCLVLAVRELAPPRPPASVSVGGVAVKTAALERLVAARLKAEIPGVAPVGVRVAASTGGWEVAAVVDAPPSDLDGLRERAVRVTADELARAAGGSLAGLDLEVRAFTRSFR